MKKLIELILATAMIFAVAISVSAETKEYTDEEILIGLSTGEIKNEYTEADKETKAEEELNNVKEYARKLYGKTDNLQQDFVFLSEEFPCLLSNSGDKNFVLTVYGEKLSLNKNAVYIELYSFAGESNDIIADIEISYYSEDGSEPYLESSDGEKIPLGRLTEISSIVGQESGYVCSLSLKKAALDDFCFIRNYDIPAWTLKLVSPDSGMIISSLNTSIRDDGFSFIETESVDENEVSYDKELLLQANYHTGVKSSTVRCELSNEAVTLKVYGDDGLEVDCNKELSTSSVKVVYLAGEEESNQTDDFDTDELQVTDDEEESIISLTDGVASTIYTDSFLFLEDGENASVELNSGILGKDYTVSVYDAPGIISADVVDLFDPLELLGESFDEGMLSESSMAIRIAAANGSGYAGELELSAGKASEGEDAVRVASPSDAVRLENGENDSCSYAFLKTGETYYPVNAGTATLTDAFLKKASCCALDQSGTVIAVYNEHGQLVELAEGCEEDEVAFYVLIPAGEFIGGQAEDGRISRLSFTYNDVLCSENPYVELTCVNEEFAFAETAALVSGLLDMDSSLKLGVLLDEEGSLINVTGMDELTSVDCFGDWVLDKSESEEKSDEKEDTEAEKSAGTEEATAENTGNNEAAAETVQTEKSEEETAEIKTTEIKTTETNTAETEEASEAESTDADGADDVPAETEAPNEVENPGVVEEGSAEETSPITEEPPQSSEPAEDTPGIEESVEAGSEATAETLPELQETERPAEETPPPEVSCTETEETTAGEAVEAEVSDSEGSEEGHSPGFSAFSYTKMISAGTFAFLKPMVREFLMESLQRFVRSILTVFGLPVL